MMSLVEGKTLGQFLSTSILLPPGAASARKLRRQVLSWSALESSQAPTTAATGSDCGFCGGWAGCCASCASAALPKRLAAMATTTIRLMSKLLTLTFARYHAQPVPSCRSGHGTDAIHRLALPGSPRRLRNRRQRRLAGGPGGDVVDDELIHLLAGIDRCRAEMREQHHVVHRDQFLRHVGLLGEDVEARRHDALVLERLDQRRLVDHRDARHVDQNAVGTERLEHFGVDQVLRPWPARYDDHQNIDRARHLEQARAMQIVDIAPRLARVINHRHAEGI